MSYDSQTKLMIKTMEKNPKFKQFIRDFRKYWTRNSRKHEHIVVKGQFIADKVIRELNL